MLNQVEAGYIMLEQVRASWSRAVK